MNAENFRRKPRSTLFPTYTKVPPLHISDGSNFRGVSPTPVQSTGPFCRLQGQAWRRFAVVHCYLRLGWFVLRLSPYSVTNSYIRSEFEFEGRPKRLRPLVTGEIRTSGCGDGRDSAHESASAFLQVPCGSIGVESLLTGLLLLPLHVGHLPRGNGSTSIHLMEKSRLFFGNLNSPGSCFTNIHSMPIGIGATSSTFIRA